MSTSTIQPTPQMFAAKRPSQLAAPTVKDTRCGEGHMPDGRLFVCTRRQHADRKHIDLRHNVAWSA